MGQTRMAIPERVWRKGWRRDAAKTQAASAEVAAFIGWLAEHGLTDAATIVRQAAMQHGVRKTKVSIGAGINAMRGSRRKSP